MVLNRKKLISFLEDYLEGNISFDDLESLASNAIFSESENAVDNIDYSLIYDVLYYLDNVTNGIFIFNQSSARFLISILKNVKNSIIASQLLIIVQFANEFQRVISEYKQNNNEINLAKELKKFKFNQDTEKKLLNYILDNGADKLTFYIHDNNAVRISQIIAENS